MLSFHEQKTQSNVRMSLTKSSKLFLLTVWLTDINSELDELDREEFYRLKKVAGKKQKDNAAEDANMRAKKFPAERHELQPPSNNDADMLAAEEDQDIIF